METSSTAAANEASPARTTADTGLEEQHYQIVFSTTPSSLRPTPTQVIFSTTSSSVLHHHQNKVWLDQDKHGQAVEVEDTYDGTYGGVVRSIVQLQYVRPSLTMDFIHRAEKRITGGSRVDLGKFGQFPGLLLSEQGREYVSADYAMSRPSIRSGNLGALVGFGFVSE
ncbi:hypothetical protein C8A01DRAFT_37339 [Parachaetomium inaequale]|uniref:Uncharacterized protein n=1 Tax=Parachaetomium inaequale TaxID=2588326 RepID=A0AAN6PEQ7_9PEZI|nr:hypothetical protein C8A01DRAFT_37339 [Parachaetomium inaequale]